MSSEFPQFNVTTSETSLPMAQEQRVTFWSLMKKYLVRARILVSVELENTGTEALTDMTDVNSNELMELMNKQKEEEMKGDINSIPTCILGCLYDRFLKSGCSHNNYYCFCSRMTDTLLDQKVQECMKGCPYNEEQIYAKITIVEFCEIHSDDDLQLHFPWFLVEHESHKRQLSSSGVLPPPATQTTTITLTAPWGVAPYTITGPESGGTVTVAEYITDTDVLTTFFTTTTIPSGQTPYTSTFTDQSSAAITEVIGATAGSSLGSSSPSTSGLSSGAKIGIGVTIPLAFIAFAGVGLLWFFRRRRNNRGFGPGAPETHDERLPEPTSTIAALKEPKDHPPSYRGLHVEAGGTPISEMNQYQHPTAVVASPEPASHELNAVAGEQRHYPSQELSSDQQRYEASGNPVYTGHELPTQLMTPSPTPASPVSSPRRKPISITAASPGPSSSSFPPPWDPSGAAEYERDLHIGPAEAAIAEDQELKELEEEVARVKMQKQRLQELQALEAREDELRRSIAERKKMGAKKP